jgi:hypothetical protein
MKTYEVELKRTSFVTITVEAKDMEEAEFMAWQQIEQGRGEDGHANWEVESIEEITK